MSFRRLWHIPAERTSKAAYCFCIFVGLALLCAVQIEKHSNEELLMTFTPGLGEDT